MQRVRSLLLRLIDRLLPERLLARFSFYPPQSVRRQQRYWVSRLRARHNFQRFRSHVSLSPSSKVLDLGCGDGVLALRLAKVLKAEGQYRGIDPTAEWILWLQQNVTPRWPNFRFEVIDIANSFYNPEGSVLPSEVRFPYPDSHFDVVIANHVLMYLVEEELTRYLAEIHRMLVPGGDCYATAFIIEDPADRDLIERSYSEHHHGHLRAHVSVTAASLGFRRCEVLPGSWRRSGFVYQKNAIRHRSDTLLLQK